MKTTDNGSKLRKFVFENYRDEKITIGDLVQLITLCFELLNLKTIAKFAKDNKKTYNGVKKFNKNIVEINGQKFVIDKN